MQQLYYLINNCKNLVLSWGANSWCNSVFVNKNQKLITLCHEGYKNEYEGFKQFEKVEEIYSQWTPLCKKNIILYDLKTELTETTKNLLIDTLETYF